MKCDVDIRKDLYASVVLSGGTIMFHGFGEPSTVGTIYDENQGCDSTGARKPTEFTTCLFQSIMECNEDFRRVLYCNVVLSGCHTTFQEIGGHTDGQVLKWCL